MLNVSAGNLGKTLHFGRPYLGHLVLASLLSMMTVGADLVFLWLLKSLVDAGFAARNLTLLRWYALGALSVVLVRSALGYGSGYLLSYIDSRITTDIQNSLYSRIQNLSLEFHTSQSPGYLLTLLFYDAGAMLQIITSLSGSLVRELFRIPAIIVFLFSLHTELALFALIVFPPVFVSIRLFGRMIRKSTERMRELVTRLYTVAEEALSHMEIVKTFARETRETERFMGLNTQMLKSSLRAYRATGLSSPVNQLIKMAGVTLLVFLGTRQVALGRLSVGGLTTFLASAYYLYGGLSSLTSWYFSVLSGLVSAERVFQVLDAEPRVRAPAGGVRLSSFEREIVMEDVGFIYETGRAEVLQGIDLRLSRGRTLALVGPSGSGKSTLVKLMLRLYDPVSGRITMDGHALPDLDLVSLREIFGVAAQDPGLFQDNVAAAISYGRPDATMEAIKKAAFKAGIDGFIDGLPEGYLTPIGDRGVRLSGGEKQRLAVARALLRDPDILVLDEALSSVDAPTERAVLERISAERRGATNILISHRLTSVAHADLIVVLDKGRIAAQGSHQELLASYKPYRDWFFIQQSVHDAVAG
jgi:subfamily B ATP-binding cassette protein MsbA